MKHRKIFALIAAAAVLLSLVGCGEKEDLQNAADKAAEEERAVEVTEEKIGSEDKASGENVLVVYFSRTGEQYRVGEIEKGNTAIVAEIIAEKTGADMFEVLPANDNYPTTYAELTEVAKEEQNQNSRPEYKEGVPDLSQYNTVFIGAPVWWGDWPMIMYTFFENEDLSGKNLIPFSTHEGSGLSGFDKKLSSAVPRSDVLKGFAVSGSDAQNNTERVRNDVQNWLDGLEY